MRTFYVVEIAETARPSPRSDEKEQSLFNKITEKFKTLDEAKAYLTDRYGKRYQNCQPIYVDLKDGSTVEVGFIRSYWNKDYSHHGKSWWQTDWVSVYEITESPVIVRGESA